MLNCHSTALITEQPMLIMGTRQELISTGAHVDAASYSCSGGAAGLHTNRHLPLTIEEDVFHTCQDGLSPKPTLNNMLLCLPAWGKGFLLLF